MMTDPGVKTEIDPDVKTLTGLDATSMMTAVVRAAMMTVIVAPAALTKSVPAVTRPRLAMRSACVALK